MTMKLKVSLDSIDGESHSLPNHDATSSIYLRHIDAALYDLSPFEFLKNIRPAAS
jgi:hypothetical protein